MVDPMEFGSYREYGEAEYEVAMVSCWRAYPSGLFECGRCGLFEETAKLECPRCKEPMLKADTWRGK